jgi:secondary thiamine-phosphate synthase enzyme
MVFHKRLEFETGGDAEIIDLTGDVSDIVRETGLDSGLVNIFAPGSTAGITTVEYESGLVRDIKQLMDELIPQNRDWAHNMTWGDGNGHSHLRASLFGPSLSVPIIDGRLVLGTWQQIIFIDFDNRPRNRSVVVTLIGEE